MAPSRPNITKPASNTVALAAITHFTWVDQATPCIARPHSSLASVGTSNAMPTAGAKKFSKWLRKSTLSMGGRYCRSGTAFPVLFGLPVTWHAAKSSLIQSKNLKAEGKTGTVDDCSVEPWIL
jgi:hypothetical protein